MESGHDGRWGNDLPYDPAEALVKIRATPSEPERFDKCVFNVDGKVTMPSACPRAWCDGEKIIGCPSPYALIGLHGPTLGPDTIDRGNDGEDHVFRQVVGLSVWLAEEDRSCWEERRWPHSFEFDVEDELRLPCC